MHRERDAHDQHQQQQHPRNRPARAPPSPCDRAPHPQAARSRAGRLRLGLRPLRLLLPPQAPVARSLDVSAARRDGSAWRSLRVALHDARLPTGVAALAAFGLSPARPCARRLRPLHWRSLALSYRAVPDAARRRPRCGARQPQAFRPRGPSGVSLPARPAGSRVKGGLEGVKGKGLERAPTPSATFLSNSDEQETRSWHSV